MSRLFQCRARLIDPRPKISGITFFDSVRSERIRIRQKLVESGFNRCAKSDEVFELVNFFERDIMGNQPRLERLLSGLLTMKTCRVQRRGVANAKLSVSEIAFSFLQPLLSEVSVVFHRELCPRAWPWSQSRGW